MAGAEAATASSVVDIPAGDRPRRAAGPWQIAAHATWAPAVGDIKRGEFEGGPPASALGSGLRLERRLHDNWTAGVLLSSRTWRVDAPRDPGDHLPDGSFVDAGLLVKFHPLRFDLNGPLEVYLMGAAGPTLLGGERTLELQAEDETTALEAVRFEAGYNVGGAVGASWLPFSHLGFFMEAGLDWHYAVYSRREIALQTNLPGIEQEPALAEKLWIGQAIVSVGALYRF